MREKGNRQLVREAAEADLNVFATLVTPERMYGDVHRELMDWLQVNENNQLVLLPRAHQKSHIMALWTAWYITNNPETTIIYVSATATLAEKQLYAIKGILESSTYRHYWPEMIKEEVGKRERWNVSEIIIDHPIRKQQGVRDATVYATGLTATTTGLHCDAIVYDDVVVPENAYTEDGRGKVSSSLSQFASIRNAGGITKAAGTRYHPNDQYSLFKKQEVSVFDDTGNLLSRKPRWEVFERVVETNMEFLWPRQYRHDGKWFGFNSQVLAEIKSEYDDKSQFFAQYYNNPEDASLAKLRRKDFQYFNQRDVERDDDGTWYVRDERINIFAAIDFAFSLNTKADYTSLVVIGVTADNDFYVLEIVRFKTEEIKDYFEAIYQTWMKWEYKVLRAEVTAAQSSIVREIETKYIKKYNLRLKIDEFRPNKSLGSKEERMDSVLNPKYKMKSIYHYRGGNTQILEEELLMNHPPHDDVKDALAAAIDVAAPPLRRAPRRTTAKSGSNITNNRFGGNRY